MPFMRKIRSLVAWPLVILMLLLAMPAGYARAAIVSTDTILSGSGSAGDRAAVGAFLQRDDVRQQLAAFGVSDSEAASRVDSMSDVEVAAVAEKIDTLPAGQSVAVILLLVILLILLIPWR